MHLEEYLQEDASAEQPVNVAAILYSLKSLQSIDFEDDMWKNDYPFVKQFVADQSAGLSAFLSKWWDDETASYHHMLDLADATETNDPHEVIFVENGAYIVGIEFHSEKNEAFYWLSYPKGEVYDEGDGQQLYVEKEHYEALMADLFSWMK